MSTTWQCPSCATANLTTDSVCAACHQPRVVPPSVPVVRPQAPSHPVPPAPPTPQWPTAAPHTYVPPPPPTPPPAVVPVYAAPAAPAAPRGGPRVGAIVAVVVLLIAVAGGAYLLGQQGSGDVSTDADRSSTNLDADTDRVSEEISDETTDPDAPENDEDRDEEDVTTTTRPPTTTTTMPYQVQGSMALVQEYLDALTMGDWNTARYIRPGLAASTDEALADGYRGMEYATAVYAGGDATNLLIASVANEDVSTGRQTRVWCYAIEVDEYAGTIAVTDNNATPPVVHEGWLDTEDVLDEIAACG